MAIKFDDFTVVIGTSRRSYSEFYTWGAVFDLSNGKLIDVLHYHTDANTITSNDFLRIFYFPIF